MSLILNSPNVFHYDEKRLIFSHPFVDKRDHQKDFTVIDNTNYVTHACVEKSFPKNPPINKSKYKVETLPRGYRALKHFTPSGYISTERQQEEAKFALLADIEMRKRVAKTNNLTSV